MFSVIRKTLGIALAIILFIIITSIGSIYFWWSTNTAPVSNIKKEVEIEIISGDTVSAVAERMESQNIIRNAFTFRLWHQLSGDEIKLQRGIYTVSPSMTYEEIANTLSRDKPQTVRVTLREGARVEEYAEKLSDQLDNTFRVDEFIKQAKKYEGQLFPDTYEFYKNENAANVITTLKSNFDQKYASIEGPTGEAQLKETLIIASLIEREGINNADRRMISGIIRNRLEIDMPLQIDATLQYVRDSQKMPEVWWASPEPSLKDLKSPYNTYQNIGLPPSPIANPSLDAIKAALQPTNNDYIYYLHAKGEAYYAKTLDQHEANINRYLR